MMAHSDPTCWCQRDHPGPVRRWALGNGRAQGRVGSVRLFPLLIPQALQHRPALPSPTDLD